jgi:hypothetical protein
MTNKLKQGLAGLLLAGAFLGTNVKAADKQGVRVSTNIVQRVASYSPIREPANQKTRQQTNSFPAYIDIEGKNYPDPHYTGNDMFARDGEQMILARTLYGEARGELSNHDYVYGVARSIINRARKMNRTIKETVLDSNAKKTRNGEIEVYAYSCFDPKQKVLGKLKDPTANDSKSVWKKCYEIAGEAMQGKLKGKEMLDDVTNYYVGHEAAQNRTKQKAEQNGIPSWAFKMKNGRFVLDSQKMRVPRKPAAEVDLSKGKRAYFYSFDYF